jgi:hypothetical protein
MRFGAMRGLAAVIEQTKTPGCHLRVETIAVGWLFTCGSEYATTSVVTTAVKGSPGSARRLLRRAEGLAAEVRPAQSAINASVWKQEGHEDDRGTSQYL